MGEGPLPPHFSHLTKENIKYVYLFKYSIIKVVIMKTTITLPPSPLLIQIIDIQIISLLILLGSFINKFV